MRPVEAAAYFILWK